MQTFESAREFSSALEEAMRPALADDELRRQLAATLESTETELRAQAAGASDEGLNLRLGRFFLREEDLPIVESIGIASTAALALLAPGVLVAGVVITALSSFAGLVWKAWRNGAMMSPREIAVLALIELHGPIEPDALKALAARADPPLAPETVDYALERLQDMEMRDGDIVSLVRQDDSGRLLAARG
jgi:hypothetical protein